MLWPASKRSNRALSPALFPRQPQAVLGWKNRKRGAAPMAPRAGRVTRWLFLADSTSSSALPGWASLTVEVITEFSLEGQEQMQLRRVLTWRFRTELA